MLTGKPVKLASGRVDHAVPSPDGQHLLTAGDLANVARLWDLATGQPIGPPIQHPDRVTAIAYRPDGKVFATGCKDGTARLWDAATGQRVGQPMVHKYAVVALAFSPDGQTLVAGCKEIIFGTAGEARLWNAATGQPLCPPLAHAYPVVAVAFRPDGKGVATGDSAPISSGPGDGNIAIWELPGRESKPLTEVRQELQVWTGLKLQDADRFETLSPEAWQKLQQQTRDH